MVENIFLNQIFQITILQFLDILRSSDSTNHVLAVDLCARGTFELELRYQPITQAYRYSDNITQVQIKAGRL